MSGLSSGKGRDEGDRGRSHSNHRAAAESPPTAPPQPTPGSLIARTNERLAGGCKHRKLFPQTEIFSLLLFLNSCASNSSFLHECPSPTVPPGTSNKPLEATLPPTMVFLPHIRNTFQLYDFVLKTFNMSRGLQCKRHKKYTGTRALPRHPSVCSSPAASLSPPTLHTRDWTTGHSAPSPFWGAAQTSDRYLGLTHEMHDIQCHVQCLRQTLKRCCFS